MLTFITILPLIIGWLIYKCWSLYECWSIHGCWSVQNDFQLSTINQTRCHVASDALWLDILNILINILLANQQDILLLMPNEALRANVDKLFNYLNICISMY